MQIGITYVVYHPRKIFCACNCESAFCRWIRFQGCFWCGSKLYKTDGKNYKNTPTSIFDDADNLGVMTISDKSDFSIKQSIHIMKQRSWNTLLVYIWLIFLHKSFLLYTLIIKLNGNHRQNSENHFLIRVEVWPVGTCGVLLKHAVCHVIRPPCLSRA